MLNKDYTKKLNPPHFYILTEETSNEIRPHVKVIWDNQSKCPEIPRIVVIWDNQSKKKIKILINGVERGLDDIHPDN